MKKYEILENDTIEVDGKKLYRIRSLKHFITADGMIAVHPGNLGGYIESEHNLDQSEKCWVGETGMVYGNAKVYDDGFVGNGSVVYQNAEICGRSIVVSNSKIQGNAKVCGEVMLFDTIVMDNAQVLGNSSYIGGLIICNDAVLTSYTNKIVSFDDIFEIIS